MSDKIKRNLINTSDANPENTTLIPTTHETATNIVTIESLHAKELSDSKGKSNSRVEPVVDAATLDDPDINIAAGKDVHTIDDKTVTVDIDVASTAIDAESMPNDGLNETAQNDEMLKDNVPPTDVSLICDDIVGKPTNYPKTKPIKRTYSLLLVIALILIFLLVMAYQTLFGHLNRPQGELIIDEGQSYFGLLSQFQQDVPMFSATLAKLYIKSKVNAPLNAGTFAMPEDPNLIQFFEVLQQEQTIDTVAVQIIEGKTANELYKTLANTKGIELEVLQEDGRPKSNLKQLLGISAFTPEGRYSDNLEGWFTPDTYHYARGATDKQILIDLYTYQQQALDKAWEGRADNLPYNSPYEALIMASIIEKETSVASERELVAAVFINRLNKGMRLQTDPTIIYGMGERYDGNIRRDDIDEKTDYNTYQINGLPPTPIALPSHASIEAAMHPAADDALYFVATGIGGHKFSKTLAEHNTAVQAYLKVIRNSN